MVDFAPTSVISQVTPVVYAVCKARVIIVAVLTV